MLSKSGKAQEKHTANERMGSGPKASIFQMENPLHVQMQRMQQTIGNRATGEWLSRRITPATKPELSSESGSETTLIQMQRDLTPNTTVSVSQGELYGEIKEMIENDTFQVYEYVVRVESKSVQLGKEQNWTWTKEKVDQPFEEKTDFIKDYLDGEENKVNARVEFYSEVLDATAEGVIVKMIPLPLEQEYDVAVSWDRGTLLQEPYVERFKEEEVVQTAVIPPSDPLRPVPQGGYKFTHFHENDRHPRASEYLEAGVDDLNMTKHGLGSGIYGLSGLSDTQISNQERSHDSKAEIITLEQPLHLQHDQHGEEFTVMSKRLEKLAETIKNKFGKKAMEATSIEQGLQENESVVTELMKNIDMVLARVRKKAPGLDTVKVALSQFLHAYFTRPQYVAQPINYLMEHLGYDGVFAETNRFNAFDRGNIKYVSDQDETIEKKLSKDRL